LLVGSQKFKYGPFPSPLALPQSAYFFSSCDHLSVLETLSVFPFFFYFFFQVLPNFSQISLDAPKFLPEEFEYILNFYPVRQSLISFFHSLFLLHFLVTAVFFFFTRLSDGNRMPILLKSLSISGPPFQALLAIQIPVVSRL